MRHARPHPRQADLERLERALARARGGELAWAALVLRGLPDDERAAFLLSESGGLTPRGVAAVLGVRPHRARRLVADAEEHVLLDPRVLGDAWRCAGATLLPGYVSGRLTPVGRLLARSHVRHCPHCRTALAAYRRMRAAAETLVIARRDRAVLGPARHEAA